MVGNGNKTPFQPSVSIWLCIIVVRTRPFFDRLIASLRTAVISFSTPFKLIKLDLKYEKLRICYNTTTGYVITPKALKLL